MEATLTHWKKLTNVNYLGAYSLDPGKDLILTIQNVTRETITGTDGKKEEAMIIRFAEPNVKPFICNKTNAKMIAKIHKTHYIEQWVGKKIQLYAKEVAAFGTTTDALRIRETAPVTNEYNPTADIFQLEGCGSLDELKAAYLKLSKAAQSSPVLNARVEELKAAFKPVKA